MDLKQFVRDVAPALKAAFIKAAKVGAYIVLSAALALVYAYVAEAPFDPSVMVIVNLALSAAQKGLATLKD